MSNGKRVTATEHDGEYRLDGRLEVGLSDHEVTVDLRRNQVSCLPNPISVHLTPDDHDFMFYDLVSGEQLPNGNEKFVHRSYALLARTSLELNIEPLEIRRVFDGSWTLRAFRNQVPFDLKIYSNGRVVWSAQDSVEVQAHREILKLRVKSIGGRWGTPSTFVVESEAELTPTHLLMNGRRYPLNPSGVDGKFSTSVILEPGIKYEEVNARVECIVNNRVRWFGADLKIGPTEGIAIDTEEGWKVFKETADLDAEYLMKYRILTSLPSRFEGDVVSPTDWAFMEGSHFCGRPSLSDCTIGADLHAVGSPLQLSPRPYNQFAQGYKIARSVIHSGIINWIDSYEGFWRIQIRKMFELGDDHDIWVWYTGSESPAVLERSAWWQQESICFALAEADVLPIAFAISYEGAWLGARTAGQGWEGFNSLIKSCTNWETMAAWLKWWRVPLLHPMLQAVTSALVEAAPVETLRAWTLREVLFSPASFSEDYEDSWRTVSRSILWNWLPTQAESVAALQSFGLLSGEFLRDLDEAWEGYEDLLVTNPLLLAQLAGRGAYGIYPDNLNARQTFLGRLRNQLLEIDRSASLDTVSRALQDCQQQAAESMTVDAVFVSKSLLRDSFSLMEGNLEQHGNLRVALSNSYAFQRYLAAKILDLMITGRLL